MWFGSVLSLFPKSRSRQPRNQAARRRRARRLLLEPLDARRVLAFSPFSEYDVGSGASVQVAADVTGDGRIDQVISTDLGIYLLRGQGDGTFAAPTQIPLANQGGRSVVAGDFNGDGSLDLAVRNTILLNDGTGNFTQGVTAQLPLRTPFGYHTPVGQTPGSAVVGDLNEDGKLDLIIAGRTFASELIFQGPYGNYYQDFHGTHVNVLLGNGNGTFSLSSAQDTNVLADSLSLTDLNEDGNLDVVVGTQSYPVAFQLPGNGDGTLQPSVGIDTDGIASRNLLLGDFDDDGHVDLLSIQSGFRGFTLTRGLGDGTFAAPTPITPQQDGGRMIRSAAVGDINGDGKIDIAYVTQHVEVTEYGYDPVYGSYPIRGEVHTLAHVLLGRGNGAFGTAITSSLGTVEGFNTVLDSTLLADFNGDGRLDLAAGDRNFGAVTVALNDGSWAAPPNLSISNVTIVEGTGQNLEAVFAVTIDTVPAGGVSYRFATQDLEARAGFDYTATTGTITFGPGVTSRMIRVPILGDATDEYDEKFRLQLTSMTGEAAMAAVGTIVDNDAPPTISIGDVTRPEGNSGTTLFSFPLTLSAPSEKPIQVSLSYANGTAQGNRVDYYGTSFNVVIAGTTALAEVEVIGDRLNEPNETFFVNIDLTDNATIADGQGVGTILNDDSSAPPPPPQIRISDAQIVEGNSGTRTMTFTVTLSQASTKEVRVNYATANGSARTSDNDYVSTSGTIKFAAGQTTKTITVTVKGDKKVESNEDFFLLLSGATNGTIGDGKGVGTILNDDSGSSSTKLKASGLWEALACLTDSLSNRRKR